MSKLIFVKILFILSFISCKPSNDSTTARKNSCKDCFFYKTKDLQEFKDRFAPAEGEIKPSHVTAITPDNDYVASKDELIEVLKQTPNDGKKIPIKVDDIQNLPLKDQQIIRVLINQGHLVVKGAYLVGHDGTILTFSNLEDFIYRFDVALNYQKDQQAQQNNGDEDSGSNPESQQASSSNSLSAGQVTAVLGAVGTFFWGYREWTSNSQILKQANVDYQEKLAIKQKFDEIDSRSIRKTDLGNQFNRKGFTAPTKPKIGSVFNPSSPKFGKFVFSPLLIATSALLIGLSIDDIRNN